MGQRKQLSLPIIHNNQGFAVKTKKHSLYMKSKIKYYINIKALLLQ